MEFFSPYGALLTRSYGAENPPPHSSPPTENILVNIEIGSPMSISIAPTSHRRGGARAGAGRKAGGHNTVPPDRVRDDASRRVPVALAALDSVLADPGQPGAEARALAASAILNAALFSQTAEV